MSIVWMTRVWQAPHPKGPDRMMLLALADNANDEGFCWPSIRRLSEKCAIGERAARRTVHRLVAQGYLKAEERAGRSTVYHLQGARLTPVVDDPPVVGDSPDAGARATPVVVAPPPLSPTTDEPSKNRHRNRQQHARGSAQGDGVPAVDGCGMGAVSLTPVGKISRDVLPAAAADLEESKDLIGLLAGRGVDRPVAERLVATYPGGHVRAMIERGDREANGPGWYVRAIEEGYQPLGRAGPHAGKQDFTHAEALAWCAQNGIALSSMKPLTAFFTVCRAHGAAVFRLRQQHNPLR